MGDDKRLCRGERSGRYVSDGGRFDPESRDRRNKDVARDCDRRWGDDRYRDRERFRYRDRDSPEQRGRKRHNSDRCEDDDYEEDYPDQDYKMEQEEESHIIMLKGLSVHVTEDAIRAALEQLPGPQPVDIRLWKKRTGISRGFAFVEFYHLQDATRWMETNQNSLVIQGKGIAVHYSNRRLENWVCNDCGLYNFRKRLKCFKCADNNGDTIILRNIGPFSNVDGILTILAPYTNLPVGNVRLIKDKQTGQNRGFAFVQLSSPLEASQLLGVLHSLQPPLELDGNTLDVEYAKSARKPDSVQPEGTRAAALSIVNASTAIAAAQWSSSQLQPGSGAPFDYTTSQGGFAQSTQGQNPELWQRQPEGLAPVIGDGLLGNTAPGVKTWPRAATGVVMSQPAFQVHAAQQAFAGVCNSSLASATSTVAVPTVNTSVAPDIGSYQYDESSGYYYDPRSGLYYDPNSQYYYNSESQQYLYWDGEKQAYIPAPAASDTSTEQASTANTASSPTSAKEKKDKPKSKSAQQIAKDMERWAKSLNRQKEKSCFQAPKDEDGAESAAADAGFTLFQKKQFAGFEMQPPIMEQVKITEQETSTKSGLVAAYNEDSDPEEAEPENADEEEAGKLTDWNKKACLLCRRQFPNKETLLRHQQLSDLHKQNLEIHRRAKLSEAELEALQRKEAELKYRDRAAERREKYGVPEPPALPALKKKKQFFHPPTPTVNYEQPTKDGLTSDNIGNKMLQAMGWQEGKGLGRHQQGITAPISATLRTRGTGLGIKASSYELSASDTYKDAVRKAMFARFDEVE